MLSRRGIPWCWFGRGRSRLVVWVYGRLLYGVFSPLSCTVTSTTIVPKAIHQHMYNMSRTFRKLNPHRHRTHGSGYLANDNLNSAQTRNPNISHRTHLITTVKAKAQPSHHQNPPTPTTHKDQHQHQHQQPHPRTKPQNYPNLKQPQPPPASPIPKTTASTYIPPHKKTQVNPSSQRKILPNFPWLGRCRCVISIFNFQEGKTTQ